MRLRDKKILWKRDSLTPSGNSSICKGVSKGDKIYFSGDNTMYCLDANTGNTIWLFKFNPGSSRTLFNADPVLVNNMLIIKPGDETIWAFNPDNGFIIGQNHDGGETPGNLSFKDDRLYYTSAGRGRVYCHSLITGALIWKYKVEEEQYTDQCYCWSGVGIDQETGYL